MIYCFCNFDKLTEKQYNKLYNFLPLSRKQNADKKCGIDKKIAILEYFLLKKLLKFKNFPDFSYSSNGKPMLKGYHFSISHTDDVLCIAIASSPVGVDIERIKPYSPNMAKYLFKNQIKAIENSLNPDLVFTSLFCKREAQIKCCDLNMTNIASEINQNFSTRFFKFKSYIICESIIKN